MSIICIIPARSGSKGLPRKNLRVLDSMPLIAHSVVDATESKLVNQVYVSTNDAEIATVAEKYGAQVIRRPEDLSGDKATSESALIHALSEIEKMEIYPEIIVFLQCTSPIRSGIDIDNAINKLKKDGADSLVSVSPSHRFLWNENGGIAKSINYDYRYRPRRQDMKKQYVENGSIYIFKPWVLKELNNRLGGNISLFLMSDNATIEIDSLIDFEIAKYFIKNNNFNV